MLRLFLLLLSFSSMQLIAQTNISGVVVNMDTKELLPYTNIALEGTSIGTITNEDGYFKLKLNKPRKRNLVIGFIGFETKVFAPKAIIPDTIFLNPTTHLLNEVKVVADGKVLNILTKAFQNIEKNYPQQPTKLTGYYRELLKDTADYCLNLSEGMLDFVKSKYNNANKRDLGQIKINKARTYFFPQIDTISKLAFIATHFVAGNGDFVKGRSKFINPKFFNHYKYNLTRILLDGEKEIYEIYFSTENGKLKGHAEGRLLVDGETYAYIGGDIRLNERGIKNRNAKRLPGTGYKSLAISYKTRFQKINDKWHLKYVTFEGSGFDKSTNNKLLFADDFVVNKVMVEDVKPIPLEERISFGEVFARQKNNDFDFFKEQSILEQESALESQIALLIKDLEKKESVEELNTLYNQKKSTEKLYQLTAKLETGYEAGYFPLSLEQLSLKIIGLGEGNMPIELERELLGFTNIFSRYAYVGFKFNKRWGISIGNYKNYDTKKLFRENEIGVTYIFELKKIGRPLLFRPGIYLSTSSLKVPFFDVALGQEDYKWSIGDDIFNVQDIDIGYLNYYFKAKPALNFSYSIKNRIWLNLGVDFNLPLHEKPSLTINSINIDGTKLGSIKEKRYDFNNDAFSVQNNGQTLENLSLEKGKPSFRLGIRLHL